MFDSRVEHLIRNNSYDLYSNGIRLSYNRTKRNENSKNKKKRINIMESLCNT